MKRIRNFLILPFLFLICMSFMSVAQNIGCGIPSWYNTISYADPGGTPKTYSYVEYDGKVYRNNKYIGNNELAPDMHDGWEEIGTCANISKLPLADNCASGKDWDVNKPNYNAGDLVVYNDGLYKAKYWIAGTAVPDEYTAYDFLGICVERPLITTTFSGEITELQPSLQAVRINAQVDDFGFSPLVVQFMIRKDGQASYDTYTMLNTASQYEYDWTTSAYGVYEFSIEAVNSAGLDSSVTGKLTVTNASPPQIGALSPASESKFPQISFEAIPISLDVIPGEVAVRNVKLENKTTNMMYVAQVESGNRYSLNWTPTTYDTHDFIVHVEDVNGNTFTSTEASYHIINPSAESVSFSDTKRYQIIAYRGIEKVFTFDETITDLALRNLDISGVSFDGATLTVNSSIIGRTGLKITTSGGNIYYIGLRIDYADGEVGAGLPAHLAIGSVSEDVPNDLAFWEGIDNQEVLRNKRVDTRYIYINGGADTGWPIDNPTRVVNYIKNSLRYGLIPTFIYYQIPDKNESYSTNDQSIKDPVYMTKYFENINLFLDDVKKEIGDELFVVILEPDFLGYIQQYGEDENRVTAVSETQIATGVGTLKHLVERINKTFDDRRKQDKLRMLFGWQLNLWAKAGVGGTHGVIRQTDNGDFATQLELIRQTARDIGQFGINAGILSHNANLVSIDKYGLDAMGRNSPINVNADPLTTPEDYSWFWNNDHWLNYLEFVNALHQLTQKHIVLWQITVGHINDSQTMSAYTGGMFPKMDNTSTKYEDSATTFFFGDEVVMESAERLNYFSQNKHADSKLQVDATQSKITFGNHIQETTDAGVRLILFGAGVGASTDGVGAPPTDDYFWIQKVQEYYSNGVIMLSDSDQDGVNDFDDQCANTPIGTEVDKLGCPLSLSVTDRSRINFLLYPNPSQEHLFLEVGSGSEKLLISIYNVTGQQVFAQNFDNPEINKPLKIDTKQLTKGIYLMRVKQVNTFKVYRFSKL